MIGKRERWQEDLFVAGPLSSLIPDDHVLRRVDAILDLSWLPELIRQVYCADNGQRSIDPEAALRLMLAGFFEGITKDRKLMRQAQVNLAIRWFAGYRLHESLPDHGSLTRIRQRWGADQSKQIFQRIVRQCVDAGLVGSKTMHLDAALIRADVSWESLVQIHADQVPAENPTVEDSPDDPGARKAKSTKPQKRSTTDPEATMTTSCHSFHMEPFYKQHTMVDDQEGIIVDADVTTGQASEGNQLPEQIGRIEANIGRKPDTAMANKGYAHGANYEHLEQRQIEAIIPPQTSRTKSHCIPACRFKYDTRHRLVACPAKRKLTYRGTSEKGDNYEGGIRIPFIIKWPGQITAGKQYDLPVINLDIAPTITSFLGLEGPKKGFQYDGVDLMPYLTEKNKNRPHEILYWRRDDDYAIRKGDWKLAWNDGNPTGSRRAELFNLAEDIGEKRDLSQERPDIVKELQDLFDNWDSKLPDSPWWGGPVNRKRG